MLQNNQIYKEDIAFVLINRVGIHSSVSNPTEAHD